MIRAAVVPEPELEKLATLAGIRKIPGVHFIPTTPREEFRSMIIANIEEAHYLAASANKTTLKMKKIGSLARELKKILAASNEQYLSQLLPSPVEHYISALNDLAKEAQRIGRRKKAKVSPSKMLTLYRMLFVHRLLDAAYNAGGRLGVNSRTGRGSLVDAIEILKPYLPAEFSQKLSVETLRRIKREWVKNRQNN
jgi:hypothetical protein